MVLFYKTDKFDGKIKSSDEGKVYWIELEKIKTMKLANVLIAIDGRCASGKTTLAKKLNEKLFCNVPCFLCGIAAGLLVRFYYRNKPFFRAACQEMPIQFLCNGYLPRNSEIVEFDF